MQDLDMTGPMLGMLVKAPKIYDFAMKKKSNAGRIKS